MHKESGEVAPSRSWKIKLIRRFGLFEKFNFPSQVKSEDERSKMSKSLTAVNEPRKSFWRERVRMSDEQKDESAQVQNTVGQDAQTRQQRWAPSNLRTDLREPRLKSSSGSSAKLIYQKKGISSLTDYILQSHRGKWQTWDEVINSIIYRLLM